MLRRNRSGAGTLPGRPHRKEPPISILIWCLAGFLLTATLLPFSRIPHGVVQAMDFLRLQILALSVLLAGVALAQAHGAILLLAMAVAINLAIVLKFTPLWRKQSKSAPGPIDAARRLSVLSVNVKQSNRDHDRLIRLIDENEPDVVLALEVDGGWCDALEVAHARRFPHRILRPQDNTYGLCLLSRLPVRDARVRELVTEDVPSLRVTLTLASGDDVLLYGVHPEPPVVHHDTIGRDSEIALVGLEVSTATLPVIVTGDLNDVAWSSTTRRFQRLSGLLDPRVGRGFYNTFHASVPFLRWPLDHLFHGPRFRLLSMRRLPHIGSDHFPILFSLLLANGQAGHEEIDDAPQEERAEVREMIRAEQARARDPIGADWEDDDGSR